MGDDVIKKAVDAVEDVAEKHGEKVEAGIEKIADFVDDKTGGKHSEKIDGVADKAKDLVDDAGDKARKATRKKNKKK